MYKFDVKYSIDNYSEYYKYIMVKQRLFKDILFSLMFIAIGIYWIVAKPTSGYTLPICAFALSIIMPLMNFASIPLIARSLKKKQNEIDASHIMISFEEDEIIYNNLNAKVEGEVEKTEKEFKLQYSNFYQVRETNGLFLFAIDTQTVIIIPKESSQFGDDFSSFKDFISTKIDSKRIGFLK